MCANDPLWTFHLHVIALPCVIITVRGSSAFDWTSLAKEALLGVMTDRETPMPENDQIVRLMRKLRYRLGASPQDRASC